MSLCLSGKRKRKKEIIKKRKIEKEIVQYTLQLNIRFQGSDLRKCYNISL